MVTKGTTAMKTIHHLTITRLPVGKTPGKTLLEADFAAEAPAANTGFIYFTKILCKRKIGLGTPAVSFFPDRKELRGSGFLITDYGTDHAEGNKLEILGKQGEVVAAYRYGIEKRKLHSINLFEGKNRIEEVED